MKELIKTFETFVYQNGFESGRVFDDWLRYIIHGYTLPGQPGLSDWNYTKEQNKVFMELHNLWVQEMEKQTRSEEWFDVFGNMYEEIIAGKNRRSNSGQFFTPGPLCDLMTSITQSEEVFVGKRIFDCACGSGRTLLSFHVKNPGNFCIAEDIDRTCAMMTVCNFLIHAVVGEVIWHDSLAPDHFFGAWKVNENLNRFGHKYFGIPHIQSISYEETTLKQLWNKRTEVIRVSDKLKQSADKLKQEMKLFGDFRKLSKENKQSFINKRNSYIKIVKLIVKHDQNK